MPVLTEPDEPEFARLEARHGWFARVLLVEYGESDAPSEIPGALNWLDLVPAARRYDFEDAECGLAYQSPDGAYSATVWDASGEEDDPWAVFLVDDFGARLLSEYSLLDEAMPDADREERLRRAAEDLPDRLEAGEFDRSGMAIVIPAWLASSEEI